MHRHCYCYPLLFALLRLVSRRRAGAAWAGALPPLMACCRQTPMSRLHSRCCCFHLACHRWRGWPSRAGEAPGPAYALVSGHAPRWTLLSASVAAVPVDTRFG